MDSLIAIDVNFARETEFLDTIADFSAGAISLAEIKFE